MARQREVPGYPRWWDGFRLWTRGGNVAPAPEEFLATLPPGELLDGETWAGRESIETEAKLAVQYAGKHWTDEVCFVVFDVPGVSGPWSKRIRSARRLRLSRLVQVIRPVVCRGVGHLRDMLASIVAVGGVGLVIRQRLRGRTIPRRPARDAANVERPLSFPAD